LTLKVKTPGGPVALVAALLIAAGCGGDDSASEGDGGRDTVTVQVLPITDVVPIYVGIDKGFFREENIEIKTQTAQGGAEIIPQVQNGSVQIGYSNTPSLFIAASKNLPIEIVAPADGGIGEKMGKGAIDAIMVKKDSPIREPKDLIGKTVAVNTLKNISDVSTSGALDKLGIDPRGVKYLEVPLPDMLGALDAGRVDAVFIVSPFKTIAEQSGKYRTIINPEPVLRPNMHNTAYFVSKPWGEENEELLERFLRALRKSMEYSDTHDAANRQQLAKYTELPKDVIPTIPIGERIPDCEEFEASSKILIDVMVKFDAIEERPDLEELIRPGFCDL
jgi:NitT/TauT family transport system substrate-binding protein